MSGGVRRIFGGFITARLETQIIWPTIEAQTEADATNRTMYEDFATYLCRDYKSPSGANSGNFLAPSACVSLGKTGMLMMNFVES